MHVRRLLFLATAAWLVAGRTESAAQPAPGTPPKGTNWQGSASLGATFTRGNSESALVTAKFDALRKWPHHELRLGADGAYGETDDVRNNEMARGFIQYNRLFTQKFFGYLRVDALHDGIAEVAYRVTISPGLGYYFVKNPRTEFSVQAGPGFIYERQGDESRGYMTVRLGERFEHRLTDRTRVWQTLEWLPQVDAIENSIINTEVGVETELIKALNLRVYVQNTYDNEPAPGRQKNDVKLVTALAYKF